MPVAKVAGFSFALQTAILILMEPIKQKSSPKDVFTHLLMIVTLYLSAIALGTLLFQFINLAFPDALQGTGYYVTDGAYQAMRFAIASLVVAFPIYLLTVRYLNRDYAKTPEKRSLRIRKWLIYLTLFIAAVIMIGDLISLGNQFLQGELTVRVSLKVLAVFLVSGSVFYYYLLDVKRDGSED